MTRLIERADSAYESLRRQAVWNGIVPERYPAAIARPDSRREIVELVREARRRGLRIAVRAGGHNWRAAYLRDGALLIDQRNLTAVVLDTDARIAQVEPGATHGMLADAIVPHHLGFPIGHCPTVGLGGYLLAGGYGWNPRTWGPAVWSVRGLDVVTPDGEELYIDEDNHPELYWAARGGASGFPCIATRYHLNLFPLPQMRTLRTFYPLHRLVELLPWSWRQRDWSPGIEISLIAARRPEPPYTPVTIVQTTTFGPTDEAAEALVQEVAGELPFAEDIIDPGASYPVSLDTVEGEAAWIEGRRYAVDMCWVAEGYADVARQTADLFTHAPSRLSRVIFAWALFPDGGPDVAQTCHGDLTVNVYAIWGEDESTSDATNEEWTREVMTAYEPWITGFYAGEADLSAAADRASRAYPPAKWERLRAIREQYDPDRAKLGYILEP